VRPGNRPVLASATRATGAPFRGSRVTARRSSRGSSE